MTKLQNKIKLWYLSSITGTDFNDILINLNKELVSNTEFLNSLINERKAFNTLLKIENPSYIALKNKLTTELQIKNLKANKISKYVIKNGLEDNELYQIWADKLISIQTINNKIFQSNTAIADYRSVVSNIVYKVNNTANIIKYLELIEVDENDNIIKFGDNVPNSTGNYCCNCDSDDAYLQVNPYTLEIHGACNEDYYCDDCVYKLAEEI